MKMHPTECKKNFANHVSYKRLISKIYLKTHKTQRQKEKKTNNPTKKRAEN